MNVFSLHNTLSLLDKYIAYNIVTPQIYRNIFYEYSEMSPATNVYTYMHTMWSCAYVDFQVGVGVTHSY